MTSKTTIFGANFLAAFALLLLLKAGLAYHVYTSGEEGLVSIWRIAARLPLVFGADLVSALLVAGLAVGLSLLFRRNNTAVRLVSNTVQILHGFLACFSFYLIQIFGSPLDKEVIDLTVINVGAANAPTGALRDSIIHCVTPGRVFFTVLCILTALVVLNMLLRRDLALRARKRAVVFAVAGLLTGLTFFLAPRLSAGELFGIRLSTWGLERSFLSDLVASYIKPVVERWTEPQYDFKSRFRFDPGIAADVAERSEENPFKKAIPMRTNLVLVVLESVAAEYVEEPDNAKTPFLRSLFDKGIYLANLYVHWPQTMKSLFSLFCSEYPYPGHKAESDINLRIPCKSLMEKLSEEGYRTALFQSSDSNYDRMKSFFKGRGVDVYYDKNSMPGSEGCWRNSWGIDEAVTVRAIGDWVENHKATEGDRRPFFIAYLPIAGHHPYTFPGMERPERLSDRERYDLTLGYMDRQVSTLFRRLEEMGVMSNTLFVVLSDHGQGFGRHFGSVGHAHAVYDEQVRVPAIFVGPQIAKKGGYSVPTECIDVAPTLLGLLGIQPPATMKGIDLTKADSDGVVFMGGRSPNRPLGVRVGRWKYIFNQGTGGEELYDLFSDRLERNNLIETRPDLAAIFKEAVMRWKVHTRHLIEHYAEIKREEGIP